MKTCTRCGAQKTLDEFHRMASGAQGRGAQCKACRKGSNYDRGPISVPVEPFKEAYIRSGVSKMELARRMGYLRQPRPNKYVTTSGEVRLYPRKGRVGDTSPIRRILSQKTMNYKTAVRMADALCLDYVDMGI